ncbi:UNVERIFIED_CONTAM: hypothetical protein K2H54_046137 [Gekko kuhli]
MTMTADIILKDFLEKMGQKWRSPSEAEKGSLDKEEVGRRRSRSASRGRFAESWKRLSSRRGSTKRAGLQAHQPAVSAWTRRAPPASLGRSGGSEQVAPACLPALVSESPEEKGKEEAVLSSASGRAASVARFLPGAETVRERPRSRGQDQKTPRGRRWVGSVGAGGHSCKRAPVGLCWQHARVTGILVPLESVPPKGAMPGIPAARLASRTRVVSGSEATQPRP